MPTTVEAVRQHLRRDAALADTLLRDVANLRRTARWLIAEYEWDASEEAVVSALRRYRDDHHQPPLHRDRVKLKDTRVGLQTGLALITLDRSFDLHARLPDLWPIMGPFDKYTILPSKRGLRLLLERCFLKEARSILPEGDIQDIQVPVSAIELYLPDDLGRTESMGLVTHIAGMLTHGNVTVLDVASCLPECSLLVPEDEAMDAFEAASDLTEESS